jgi:hypothetical protein
MKPTRKTTVGRDTLPLYSMAKAWSTADPGAPFLHGPTDAAGPLG